MDYSAYYRKATSEGYQAYYDVVAQAGGIDPQATARTRNAVDAVPGEAKDKLFNVAAEIKNTFHEFGAPLPPLLEGCTVVDLCCGSGRDTYLAAQLVGPGGRVIGVESNEARLGIARKYLDKEMKQFGFAEANVELVHGVPEDLSFIPDDTVDVVISNCTFNLSPDKAAYIAEVKRVLKPQGEWYFTDVFTDRRIPQATSNIIENVALRLGGALFVEDFRRMAQSLGFHDPRYVITRQTPLTDAEAARFPGIAFATITCRLLNSELTSDHCEDYGEEIIYDGSLPDYPEFFLFDKDIKFPAGKPCHVCDNVSVLGLEGCRYAKVITVKGNREVHYGDIHGDQIIKTAPDWEGIVDEDDQPLMVSCC
ncbi:MULTISPECIES: methyltransferase domain-containing protein [Gordonibacter]|uniref:Arsenite methyltransferase n=1 Tax=Gordonibacter faecis TaxID=3047475 RepID=A0ABT7DM99_9ACTN|nr:MULTISPECIES: methyltransferase domain-containing protein [unclassified Gordonibacter]MDJ1650651.1 methyltransferase domain-containing protein [Gordonibacter sp. KGMB12511]HIW75819.1 methyltransferase domain-containing protein [Candidatus Gordonibacter avicola]